MNAGSQKIDRSHIEIAKAGADYFSASFGIDRDELLSDSLLWLATHAEHAPALRRQVSFTAMKIAGKQARRRRILRDCNDRASMSQCLGAYSKSSYSQRRCTLETLAHMTVSSEIARIEKTHTEWARVLHLYYIDMLDVTEIVEATGKDRRLVNNYISRGNRRLAERLAR